MTHTPPIADPSGASKRALVLAGGGMRVAYQAGAVKALYDAGLRFSHGDGASGGTMNLAALLSGASPDELCARWRSLKVSGFVSFMPFKSYLRFPRLMAMGDARGVREKVFPHLGIDIARINCAEGIDASFNVCNFSRKTLEAMSHRALDMDRLIAGVSLPLFMPPVEVNGVTYTDAVWIKDANLLDTVKRGANELWLLWCIGNTPVYKPGAFNQYVHMIEMSAAGALNLELAALSEINARIHAGESVYGHREPIRLHVVKPEYPLPLDPDYYLHRIDGHTLVDCGYRDAKRYLASMQPEGVPLMPDAIQMQTPSPGVSFRETMQGGFSLSQTDPERGAEEGNATPLAMHATIHIRDVDAFVADPQHLGELTGHIDYAPLGTGLPSTSGVFKLFAPSGEPELKWMVYELGFEHAGKSYYLAGKKHVRTGSMFRLWDDTTTLYTTLHQGVDSSAPIIGAGVLKLGSSELMKLVSTLHPSDTGSLSQGSGAVARFGAFFARELWNTYGLKR